MRLIFAIIFFLYTVAANGQITGAVFSGAMYNQQGEQPIPVYPYQPEVIQYQDSLWANGITDTVTGINALNYLVWALKGNDPLRPHNFWDSLTAVYPLHGGTAYSHSINIRDITGVKVEWVGGMTHNANGATGDGSTAFGRSGIFYPWSNIRMSGLAVSVYNIQSYGVSSNNLGLIGVSNNPNDYIQLAVHTSPNGTAPLAAILTSGVLTFGTIVTTTGSTGTMYAQQDNRVGDSIRVWFSQGAYDARVITARQTGNSGQLRQYGVVGRITNLAANSSFPYPTPTHTFAAINIGRLEVHQGKWLTEIIDHYNYLLRGFIPNFF